MNRIGNILWGIFFVALAIVIGLNSLDIVKINLFFDGWWTIFIIVPSFISLVKDKDKTTPLIFLLVGVVLFLGSQELIDLDIIRKLIVPGILLIIGLSMIFKDVVSSGVSAKIKEISAKNKDGQSIAAVFSGEDIKFSGKEFRGLTLNAIFGGINIDLKQCDIDDDYVINTTSIFGGVDILVPEGVNVKVKSNSLFGGTDNKIKNNNINGVKTIYVNAFNLFGGTDIK